MAGGVSKLKEQHGKGTGEGMEPCTVGSGEQVGMCDISHACAWALPLQQQPLHYWFPFLYFPGKYLLLLSVPISSSSTLTVLSSLGNQSIPYLKSFWDGGSFCGTHLAPFLFLVLCTWPRPTPTTFDSFSLPFCLRASNVQKLCHPIGRSRQRVVQLTAFGAIIKQRERRFSGCFTQHLVLWRWVPQKVCHGMKPNCHSDDHTSNTTFIHYCCCWLFFLPPLSTSPQLCYLESPPK